MTQIKRCRQATLVHIVSGYLVLALLAFVWPGDSRAAATPSSSLEPAVAGEILAFLQKHSAETGLTERAYKINKSIPADRTPLRITETGYGIDKHRGIGDAVWKHPKVGSKANCGACHHDAERGTYEDAAMRLPG